MATAADKNLKNLIADYPSDINLQTDKNVTLQAVAASPMLAEFSCERLRDDKDVALAAVSRNGNALRVFSDRLKGDADVVKTAVENFPNSYAYSLAPAREDRSVVAAVAKSGGEVISLIPDKYKDDEDTARLALSRNPKAIAYFSERVRSLEPLALEVIKRDRTTVKLLSDDAFAHKSVFMLAARPAEDGKVGSNVFSDDTPYGLFAECVKRNVIINVAAQNLDCVKLDRDKFFALLQVAEGEIRLKGEVFHRFVAENDREIISALIARKFVTPSRAAAEIPFAREVSAFAVLPLLLDYGRGKNATKKTLDERKKIITGLKRGSVTAATVLKENIKKYIDDREVVLLASKTFGEILACLDESEFIRDDEIIDNCIRSYVVRNVDPPILEGLKNLRLNERQAAAICKKDERNRGYVRLKGDAT
ncbi:MAG: DUF4116 domain-containing protein [Clostridia bacterium]|nr:DUF4116 domain-containing protein [Clostridia bacterium]